MLISSFINPKNDIIKSDLKFEQFGHSDSKFPNTVTFLDSDIYINDINTNKNVTGVFVSQDILPYITRSDIFIVLSEIPRISFFESYNKYIDNVTAFFNFPSIIHESSDVRSQFISKTGVIIGANTHIGEQTIIHSGVTIGADCSIGPFNCIGNDGFEYKKHDNRVIKVTHSGGVLIGDFVDTKEFVTIHRALFNKNNTVVGNYTKIDAHSHIGHGNIIGNNTFLCSHSNISGNSVIQNNSYVGPGVNVPNRLTVGENSKITIGSTITTDIKSGSTVSGHFAFDHKKYIEHVKRISK